MEFYTSVVKWGNTIYYRGYKNNSQVLEKVGFNPTFFIPSKETTEYKSLEGKYLKPHYPGDIKEAREFVEKYKDVEGFEIYGNDNYEVQYLSQRFTKSVVPDMPLITIYALDIETSKNKETGYSSPADATEPITLITLYDFGAKRSYTFGCKPYSAKDNEEYFIAKTESDMLMMFINFFSKRYPDVVTGWNTESYDIPYLCKRIERLWDSATMKRLSPWGIITSRKFTNAYGTEEVTYDIKGVELLDYLPLYRKFSYTPREMYTLEFITQEELGVTKIDYSEYADLDELAEKDWNKFVEYNIRDTILIHKLEQKRKLLNLVITVAYEAKINYSDVFSPVNTWDAVIYNYLLQQKIIVPFGKFSARTESFEGGYVEDPIVGMHDWVITFDASSLYPSIMVAYNISPETFVGQEYSFYPEKILTKDFKIQTAATLCSNGAMFSKNKQGFIGKLVEHFLDLRKIAKNEMIEKEKQFELVKKEMERRGLKC